jgi:hypothetical protein
VNDNEYTKSKQFAEGIGRDLHEKLKNNIEKGHERSWIRQKNTFQGHIESDAIILIIKKMSILTIHHFGCELFFTFLRISRSM